MRYHRKVLSHKRRGMAARSSHTMNAQKVYPKDSIDRFGDDLCEVLLSYLSFEDRFRCECLSKQCQRVIFTTQSELLLTHKLYVQLKLYSKSADLTQFELILKKLNTH
ncbi:unnamed protein product [Oppiella nova]|uniref:F-box domain-containing protein n=1 Tax=Oppiella nova TaxID=334625 RepID=A0A7R9LPE6_9ACAR|nr:unnamed protein product [Oppiella nova]CAG2165666.1 unnamed protein product [Oppiella nova]